MKPLEEGAVRYPVSYTGPGSDAADSSDFTSALGTHSVYFQSGNKTARVAVIISTEPETDSETETPSGLRLDARCTEPEPDDMPSWGICNE